LFFYLFPTLFDSSKYEIHLRFSLFCILIAISFDQIIVIVACHVSFLSLV